jgi:hypothetical protein
MQSTQDLGNTFSRAWQLLSNNWSIALPAVIIGVVGGIVIDFVAITLMGGGALVAGLGGLLLGGLITLAIASVINVLTIGMTSGMGIAAWRTGTASISDGTAVFSNGGALQTMIAWMIIGAVLAFIPVLGWLALIVLMFLLIYAIPAAITNGTGAGASFSESVNVVTRNFGTTAIVIVLIFCIGLVGGILGAVVGHVPFLGGVVRTVIQQVILAYGTLVICGEYLKCRSAAGTPGAAPPV